MERAEIRVFRYDDVVRRALAYHKAQGQVVDVQMIRGGQIVASYRLRAPESDAWQDLLPTGTSPTEYRRVIQRLVPILFPGESVEIATIVRGADEVTVTLAPTPPPAS